MLIYYKPVSVSNKTFFEEVRSIFENWIRPKLNDTLSPVAPQSPSAQKAYNITFS